MSLQAQEAKCVEVTTTTTIIIMVIIMIVVIMIIIIIVVIIIISHSIHSLAVKRMCIFYCRQTLVYVYNSSHSNSNSNHINKTTISLLLDMKMAEPLS